MTEIIAFLATKLGRIVLGATALAGFLAYAVHDIRKSGAASALAKVEKNNATVRQAAGSAGRKSMDPHAAGVVNPYYRD